MAHIDFEKVSEHTAQIKGVSKLLWRIRILNSIDEYYVLAEKAHAKLGGHYWCDSRYLIDTNKVAIEQPYTPQLPQIPTTYQQIYCGQCNHLNLLNIDKPAQGAHFCLKCRSTVCIVIGKNLLLKNGSKAGNVVQR